MKILVTGGSGTIGGYVLRELLHSGHTITNFSRTQQRTEGVEFIKGDILDEDDVLKACRRNDAVIHMAAVPGPGRATVPEMIQVNVGGTVHVLEAALKENINKVIFASSAAASGFAFQKREILPVYFPIDEEHPCNPHDEYGLSKLLAETACKRYTDAFNIQTICLRINHNWYIDLAGAEISVGTGWARKFVKVEELWDERYRFTIEDPDSERPVPGPPPPKSILWAFTDARDAAQAFRLAIENKTIQHDVFYISGAVTCSAEPTKNLLESHFPTVPIRTPLEGYTSLWSYEKAAKILGYVPKHDWRDSDFGKWLKVQNE